MDQATIDALLSDEKITPRQYEGLARTNPERWEFACAYIFSANKVYKIVKEISDPATLNRIGQEVSGRINRSYILHPAFMSLEEEDRTVMPISNRVCRELYKVADTPASAYAVGGTFFEMIRELKGVEYEPPLELRNIALIPPPHRHSMWKRVCDYVASCFA